MWTYRARVVRVVDGDTVDAMLDVGFYLTTVQRLRVAGIDTPEVRGHEREQGLAASLFTREWVTGAEAAADAAGQRWPFTVTTGKADAFGRWVADIAPAAGDGGPLAAALIAAGHADPWKKGQRS